MSYIWSDYSSKNEFRVSCKRVSPYMEVWDKDGRYVYVNILYRISRFLMPEKILDSGEKLNAQMELYVNDRRYSDIANLVMHYIARLDLLKGLGLQDFMERICRKEIEEGRYGEDIRKKFEGLKKKERNIILRYLAKYNLENQKETMFDGVICAMFDNVRLYYENSTDTVFVYIGEEKDGYKVMVYDLCMYFFKDMGVKAEVMWEGEHFGIIGVEESMRIEETALI